MNRPDVLILTPDADEYLHALHDLADAGTRLVAASSVKNIPVGPGVFPVVLGRPDYVADYLAAGAGELWGQATGDGVERVWGRRREHDGGWGG